MNTNHHAIAHDALELRPQIQIAPTWRERWACWLGGLVS